MAPKKLKLAEAESELSVQMAKLNAKRAELKGVRIKLNVEPELSVMYMSLSIRY